MNRYSRITLRPEADLPILLGGESSRTEGLQRIDLAHREVAENHACILIGADSKAWIVQTNADATPLFVNGSAVPIHRLVDRDIVQIGPFGWFYHGATTTLHPSAPMSGRGFSVTAEVEDRLLPTELSVAVGQFVAITGPSGCGKSTLLTQIRDLEGTRNDLYFMQQRDLVHEDLKLRHQLEFVAKFYGSGDVLPCDIDEALLSVGLQVEHGDRFLRKLSGGQLRRARIAMALLSRQGLLVLDEPDSGLDHETASDIIQVLQSFALRGATVIAVTHHRHVLSAFDRVIEMETTDKGGRISRDVDRLAQATSREPGRGGDGGTEAHPSGAAQFPLLVRREFRKLTSLPLVVGAKGWLGKVPSCTWLLALVPLFFALAVSVSVPTDPQLDFADGLYGKAQPIHRLGFLAVISVIWMSSSLSHLTLARERELYEHEASLGIKWRFLLPAKMLVYTAAALVQVVVFLSLLHLIRYVWLGRSYFVIENPLTLPAVMLCLSCVAIAGSALGFLISACAGRRPLIAAGLLPVLMMVQILFSVPFAVSTRDVSDPMLGYRQLVWSSAEPGEASEDLPMRAASVVSYATLSRYGDQWLRSFIAEIEHPAEHRSWAMSGVRGLSIVGVSCIGLSLVILGAGGRRSRDR